MNGGVFAFRRSYLLGIARSLLGSDEYDELFEKYDSLQKISFDYAVAEKEKSINVIRFGGEWKDLGTWNTLTEAMAEPSTGNAVVSGCENTHVINELGIPMVALGIKNAAISATPDGILVTDKEKSTQLKDFVFSMRPMYERRGWGKYKVLDYKLHDDRQQQSGQGTRHQPRVSYFIPETPVQNRDMDLHRGRRRTHNRWQNKGSP